VVGEKGGERSDPFTVQRRELEGSPNKQHHENNITVMKKGGGKEG